MGILCYITITDNEYVVSISEHFKEDKIMKSDIFSINTDYIIEFI